MQDLRRLCAIPNKHILNFNIDSEREKLSYEVIDFPSGVESVVRVNLDNFYVDDEIKIVARLTKHKHIFELFQIIDIFKKARAGKINLILTYLPNARQDRSTQEGESFSLKVFTTILNSFNLNYVGLIEPHSNVSTALINNSEEIYLKNIFTTSVNTILNGLSEDTLIVSPEAEAYKKP